MKLKMIIALSVFLTAPLVADDALLQQIKTYEREAYSRTVTSCDRLAGHPSDPERVTDGVSQASMDKEAAIAACLAAVKEDAENPRLNYQLARAYGYAGKHAEGEAYRIKALLAGYPQSLFVVGYIRLSGWDGRPKDPCFGGELVRRSAHAGRFAGLVGFPHYALTGQFSSCASYPRVDRQEMMAFLEAASGRADGYYQQILVEQLKHELSSMPQ